MHRIQLYFKLYACCYLVRIQISLSEYRLINLSDWTKIARLSVLPFIVGFFFRYRPSKPICRKHVRQDLPLARQWQGELRSRHAREERRERERGETDGAANYCTFLGPVRRLLFSPNQSARDDRERTGGRASNEKQIKFGGHVNAITRTRRDPGKNINRTCNPA